MLLHNDENTGGGNQVSAATARRKLLGKLTEILSPEEHLYRLGDAVIQSFIFNQDVPQYIREQTSYLYDAYQASWELQQYLVERRTRRERLERQRMEEELKTLRMSVDLLMTQLQEASRR